MQFLSLFHLPLSDLRYNKYSLGRDRKPAKFTWSLPLFNNHSTNISRIAHSNSGGESAAKPDQSTYWPSYDAIRTQILDWSQSCRNRIVGTAVRSQLGQKPTVLCLVRVTIPPRYSRSGSLAVSSPDRGLGSSSDPDRSRVTRNCC